MDVNKIEIKDQILKNLPYYERKSLLINEISFAAATHFFELEKMQTTIEKELFIDTAIQSLKIHARDLNISIGSALTIEQQRELVTAYYRAAFEQTNDETIKNVASSFTGGSVEINPTTTGGVFEIKFIDTLGIPDNLEGLRSALDVIIPAHLEFVFAYSYLLIRDISKMTLNELEGMTLDKFAGGKK